MAFTERTLIGINKLIADLKQMVVNSVTPARTVSWFYRDTAPIGWAICNGQTVTMNDGSSLVTPDLIGRYPLGATSAIGTTVEASLPNIKGEYYMGGIYDLQMSSGAYANSVGGPTYKFDGVSGASHWQAANGQEAHIEFDASDYNSIYKDSATTVTPPSVKLLPCIKL